ncbi:MAG: N-acetyl-gamma-glutamyl-phosphate reductase, partial [Verrucomicrobiota bacterium]
MSENAIPVVVVGASGYTGAELLRHLLQHPHVNLVGVTSRQYAGTPLAKIFPRFAGAKGAELCFSEPDIDALTSTGASLAFLALPHGVAAEFAAPLLEKGFRVIDLSADYRLRDPQIYEEFYEQPHPTPDLLSDAVYGLPEICPEAIREANLVASPGCFPTSILLPLLPLLKHGLIQHDGIVVSSMSGVSGAGRNAKLPLLYAECNESVRAYGAPKHRHLSEIEQELSLIAGESITISFTPHLVPITAGI